MILFMGIDVDHHVTHIGETVEDQPFYPIGDVVGLLYRHDQGPSPA